MPTYKYTAMHPQGYKISNKITAPNKKVCLEKLKRNNLVPISVRQTLSFGVDEKSSARKNMKNRTQAIHKETMTAILKKKSDQKGTWIDKLDKQIAASRKITPRDIRVFSQNFYLLKKANFNNIHALTTVVETTENPKFKTILEDILAGVEAGEYMYTTMEYYDSVFPYIYINMVKVGELSGSLENSMQEAVDYLESSEALKKKIRRILMPNIIMFVALTLGTFFGTLIAVPMLQGVFDEVGSTEELPPLTMWFSGVCNMIIKYWYIPVSIIAGLVFAFWKWISEPIGRYKFDMFKYKVPIFGQLIYLLDFSRLMQGVYLNLQNGLRIQDALDVSKNIVKNTVMLAMVETAINNIYVGKSWIIPFEEGNFSSQMTTEMLRIGMQTDLTEMLGKLLEYMDIDIDNTLQKITKALPEVSYIFVGIVLIFFVLVILVPIINVYMGGWLFSAYDV